MTLITQLGLGALVTCLIIIVHGGMMQQMIKVLHRHGADFAERFGRRGELTVIVLSVFWILLALTFEVWIWALVLLLAGAFDLLEPAVYFALSSFTTLGYGDLVLDDAHRVLGAMSAANGLLIFGWSTAILVGLVGRNIESQVDLEAKHKDKIGRWRGGDRN